MIPFALPLLVVPSVGGGLAAHLSSRAILSIGLALSASGNAIAAFAVLTGAGYWGSAIGMLVIGCGAGLLNAETAKALIGAVPAERAGMASGIASTTRFIGISLGLAGLGAVLAGVSESSLRRLGNQAAPGQVVDWHELSLRIVGGDANGALRGLPARLQAAIADLVGRSVTSGFAAVLAAAAVIAALSILATWSLVRPADDRSPRP